MLIRAHSGLVRKLAFRLGLGIRSALRLPANCIFLLCNPEKCIIPPGMGYAKLMPKLTFRTRPPTPVLYKKGNNQVG